jgi:hypothetical protein
MPARGRLGEARRAINTPLEYVLPTGRKSNRRRADFLAAAG